MEISPNPVNNFAIINYYFPTEVSNAKITVHNMEGKKVHEITLNPLSENMQLNLSHLANGIYTVTLYADEMYITSKKLTIIKE